MSEIEKLNIIAEWQEKHKQLIEDLDNSKKRIAELEAQIEKMKGCYNCHYGEDDSVSFPCTRCNRCIPEVIREGDTDKWELRR